MSGDRSSHSGRHRRAPVLTGCDADLMQEERDGERQRDDHELRACEEGEPEACESRRIPAWARPDERAVTEEDRPGEGGVRDILGQQGRGEDEPRCDRCQSRRDVTRGVRARDGPSQEECGYRRAHEQERVQRMRDGRRLRRRERSVERGEEEWVELAVGSVVRAPNRRDERQLVRDAGREPSDLELVGHDGPGVRADRVRAGQHPCGDHARPRGYGRRVPEQRRRA